MNSISAMIKLIVSNNIFQFYHTHLSYLSISNMYLWNAGIFQRSTEGWFAFMMIPKHFKPIPLNFVMFSKEKHLLNRHYTTPRSRSSKSWLTFSKKKYERINPRFVDHRHGGTQSSKRNCRWRRWSVCYLSASNRTLDRLQWCGCVIQSALQWYSFQLDMCPLLWKVCSCIWIPIL